MAADIAALKSAYDAAEAAKQDLLAERRANRDTMSRAEFRAYNHDTTRLQQDIQRAVDDAQKALHVALNNVRQEILVATLSESNKGSDVG